MTASDRPRTPSWFPEGAPAPARTIDEAMVRVPEATLAVIGAPRAIAAVEVRRALERGLDVLAIGEGLGPEDALTERAFGAERGRLVLHGDAVVDGVVVRGALLATPIGGLAVVAADVAAAVEATAAASRAGFGTAHVLVVGDDDLSELGGGVAALAAIRRLGADPSTTAVAVIGAGDPRVLRALQHACVATGKPAVVCALDGESRRGIGWEWIGSMVELPRALVRLGLDPATDEAGPEALDATGVILGALSGRSPAHEVIAVLARAGLDVASNVPRPGVLPEDVGGHTVMALPTAAARAAWLDRHDGAAIGAVVVDLPETPLADAEAVPLVEALGRLAGAERGGGRALRIAVSRPRGLGGERGAIDAALATLGTTVVDGAAAAARSALGGPVAGAVEPTRSELAGRPLSVITLAADEVAIALAARGIPVLAIAWTAPAGGDPRIARLVGLLR